MMRITAFALVILGGCATMGPMPATTAVSAVPAQRTSAEAQVGMMPGYYLSQAVTEEPHGDAIGQVSLAVEPGPKVPGLLAGFRIFGPDGDTLGEPMLGYRRSFGDDRRFAIAGVAFGTRGGADRGGANYRATRGGAEVLTDIRLFGETRYLEPHVLAAVSVTGLSAEGTYCLDADRTHGTDCDDPPNEMDSRSVSGVYPAATAGLAFDLAHHLKNPFHGARLSALFSAGRMPHILPGEPVSSTSYATIGLTLTLSGGASQ